MRIANAIFVAADETRDSRIDRGFEPPFLRNDCNTCFSSQVPTRSTRIRIVIYPFLILGGTQPRRHKPSVGVTRNLRKKKKIQIF